jgi:hypothetical protein
VSVRASLLCWFSLEIGFQPIESQILSSDFISSTLSGSPGFENLFSDAHALFSSFVARKS